MADPNAGEQQPVEDSSGLTLGEGEDTNQEVTNVEGTMVEDEGGATKDDIKSMRVTLADLSAKGTALYAHRKYEEATDVFSRASDLQAELNGETAPENAEILFHYGRSLFKVGQSKSDVLGGPAAAAESKSKSNGRAAGAKKTTEADAGKQKPAAAAAGGPSKAADTEGQNLPEGKKLLFQFTGDENFDDSDEDEEQEEEEQGEGEEEEDDDLATAFEILDLARVCYLKQLDGLQQETGGAKQEGEEDGGKGKEAVEDHSSAIRHIKERLAETHDCLAEISLENERYPNAIEDGRTSLNYKLDLYPEESDIIAEAHYKLSLALEFASVTISGDDGKNVKREELDQGLRNEAIKEMEAAIKSFRLKMKAAEAEVDSTAASGDNELAQKALAEMKEIVADMDQRLVDLRKDPISADDLQGGPEANPLGGLFGASLGGGSASEIAARIEEAAKGAVDLTNLVRKKKPKTADAEEGNTAGAANGKRKAQDDDDTAAAPQETESKKARVEDAPDEE
ncbi:NASP-related protein sim3 [Escovopsis weberi]|uniref:NASP-related protein sim3 n=1 Tax=Escovopsis weberi TaxID=150374 RepID=A0A0M8N4R3_ESCWE|nr:NASP-related protein sim3 [Escovopsis weberi]